jgi:hypothetical protein
VAPPEDQAANRENKLHPKYREKAAYSTQKHIGKVLLRASTDSLHRFLAEQLMERPEFELRYLKEHIGAHHSR